MLTSLAFRALLLTAVICAASAIAPAPVAEPTRAEVPEVDAPAP